MAGPGDGARWQDEAKRNGQVLQLARECGMATMRAKMYVSNITTWTDPSTKETTQLTVTLVPVSGNKPYGPNGESEDNTFARYTPSGECKLSINNPALFDKLHGGDTFYVDFTPVGQDALAAVGV